VTCCTYLLIIIKIIRGMVDPVAGYSITPATVPASLCLGA